MHGSDDGDHVVRGEHEYWKHFNDRPFPPRLFRRSPFEQRNIYVSYVYVARVVYLQKGMLYQPLPERTHASRTVTHFR